VFRCVPLFCSRSICMVFWMELKECWCSVRCFDKLEDRVPVLKALRCSLKRVVKFPPVCPTYALPQSGHVSL
jgi:hypothetical protein